MLLVTVVQFLTDASRGSVVELSVMVDDEGGCRITSNDVGGGREFSLSVLNFG